MIDPINITNYNLTVPELEEHLLFWVCAAGKTAKTAAECLDKFLCDGTTQPFVFIRELWAVGGKVAIQRRLKSCGIGCHTTKAKTFAALANANLDLHTVLVNELEQIPGIGPKTARAFVLHSRPGQRLALLDTHILKHLRENGYNAPKATPSSPTRYRELELAFLKLADEAGENPADFDLRIWKMYARI